MQEYIAVSEIGLSLKEVRSMPYSELRRFIRIYQLREEKKKEEMEKQKRKRERKS